MLGSILINTANKTDLARAFTRDHGASKECFREASDSALDVVRGPDNSYCMLPGMLTNDE
jgi:hypothetical protein